MKNPKPPTPTSVSATLRYHGYHVARDPEHGYEVTRWDDSTVCVDYWVDDDGSTESTWQAIDLRDRALKGIASTLTDKGWSVEWRGKSGPFLLVTGHGEEAAA